MKKLIVALLPLMFFIGCEDEEAAADAGSNNSIVGAWNFVATEYDTTCTGDGEVFDSGTMTFTDTEVVVSTTEDGTIDLDTLSYTYSDSLYLTYSETWGGFSPEYADECTEDGGVYVESDSSCTFSETWGVNLTFDGNTATWNDVHIDEEGPEYSYCDVFVLTKQ